MLPWTNHACNARPKGEQARAPAMERYQLLLVEDNVAFLNIAVRFLSSHPAFSSIATASNAREGLALAEVLKPQLILLDINLPETQGLLVIPQLRALLPQVKIIVLTVWDSDLYRQAALEAGADDYVTKDSIHANLLPAIWRQLLPAAPATG
jgi:DNA-binding NarL/FixJ family response regulator